MQDFMEKLVRIRAAIELMECQKKIVLKRTLDEMKDIDMLINQARSELEQMRSELEKMLGS